MHFEDLPAFRMAGNFKKLFAELKMEKVFTTFSKLNAFEENSALSHQNATLFLQISQIVCIFYPSSLCARPQYFSNILQIQFWPFLMEKLFFTMQCHLSNLNLIRFSSSKYTNIVRAAGRINK